eukprot:ctg_285.g198
MRSIAAGWRLVRRRCGVARRVSPQGVERGLKLSTIGQYGFTPAYPPPGSPPHLDTAALSGGTRLRGLRQARGACGQTGCAGQDQYDRLRAGGVARLPGGRSGGGAVARRPRIGGGAAGASGEDPDGIAHVAGGSGSDTAGSGGGGRRADGDDGPVSALRCRLAAVATRPRLDHCRHHRGPLRVRQVPVRLRQLRRSARCAAAVPGAEQRRACGAHPGGAMGHAGVRNTGGALGARPARTERAAGADRHAAGRHARHVEPAAGTAGAHMAVALGAVCVFPTSPRAQRVAGLGVPAVCLHRPVIVALLVDDDDGRRRPHRALPGRHRDQLPASVALRDRGRCDRARDDLADDPLVALLRSMYVDFDLATAPTGLQQCEEAMRQDLFLRDLREPFLEHAAGGQVVFAAGTGGEVGGGLDSDGAGGRQDRRPHQSDPHGASGGQRLRSGCGCDAVAVVSHHGAGARDGSRPGGGDGGAAGAPRT